MIIARYWLTTTLVHAVLRHIPPLAVSRLGTYSGSAGFAGIFHDTIGVPE